MTNLSIKLCLLAVFSLSVAFGQVLENSDSPLKLGAGTKFVLKQDLIIKANTYRLPIAEEVYILDTNDVDKKYHLKHECALEFDESKHARVLKKDTATFTLENISVVYDSSLSLTFQEFMYTEEDNSEEGNSEKKPSLSLECQYKYKYEYLSSPGENNYSYEHIEHSSSKLTFKDFAETLADVFEIVEAEPIEF